MTDTYLVTGAHGFLGRHTARAAAAAGARVIGLGHGDWAPGEMAEWGLSHWHSGDVDAAGLAAVADAAGGPIAGVLHCAGSGSVAASIDDPAGDFARTVGSTLALLEWMRGCAPEAGLVLPSSGGVYGRVETLPTPPDAPTRPLSPYGWHKLMSEQLARSYGAQFGLRSIAVRFFSIYGAGLRKQLLWDACNRLATGDAQFGGTGEESRDWLQVEDAARLMLAALPHAAGDAPVVNGGAGRAHAIAEIVTLVADGLGGPGRPTFSGVQRPGDPPHMCADISSARALGWEPQVALATGIADYVAWFAGQRS